MNPTVKKFLKMSRDELDEIYRNAEAGPVPPGDTKGVAILAGSCMAGFFAFIARIFAWQGKVFDIFAPPDSGVLVNKITPFGIRGIVAKVYRENSWMDKRETIVIDYSKTSLFARKIRDEIREVEPGVYLGVVWFGKTRILNFALTCK